LIPLTVGVERQPACLSGRVLGSMTRRYGCKNASLREKMRTARFGCIVDEKDNPYNVFDFHQSVDGDGPGEVLG